MRVIIVNSHPIQYFAPAYACWNSNSKIDLKVYYCSEHGTEGAHDFEFNTRVKWDISLINGYNSIFLTNQSFKPSIYSFWGLANLSIIPKLVKEPESYILIHGWNYLTNWIVVFLCFFLKHKILLKAETPISHELCKTPIVRFFRRVILGKLYFKGIHKFLFIGNQNKKFYEKMSVNQKDLIPHPYSVDNYRLSSDFDRLKKDRLLLRNKYGIPATNRVFIYSGKFIPKKNPMDLVKAFGMSNHKQSTLVLMGEGALRPQIEELIKTLNLSNVILTGFINQKEIANYYTIADIYVMCSGIGETWGLSTNEAMNFCLPLIVSNMSGCSEDLVQENVNGFTYPVGNIKELAQRIIYCQNCPYEQLTEMGEKSKKIISQYTYDIQLNFLLAGLM